MWSQGDLYRSKNKLAGSNLARNSPRSIGSTSKSIAFVKDFEPRREATEDEDENDENSMSQPGGRQSKLGKKSSAHNEPASNLTSNELEFLKNEETFLYPASGVGEGLMTQGDRLNAIKAQRRAHQTRQNHTPPPHQQPVNSTYVTANFASVNVDLK